jgi:hypothetical protein
MSEGRTRFILEEGTRGKFTFSQVGACFRALYTGQKGKEIHKGRRVANHINVNVQRYMGFEVEDIHDHMCDFLSKRKYQIYEYTLPYPHL